MRKIVIVFGTRPEAIKMCPLILLLKREKGIKLTVIVTGQHREMLKQALDVFGVTPDVDLDIMRPEQSLSDVTCAIMTLMSPLLESERPDICLVHGDTATAFATALCCFYSRIPIGHVEAGMRTYDMTSPFPEEFYRQAISKITALHFAPTDHARDNLLRENIPSENIYVTGNTVIDALRTTVLPDYTHPLIDWAGQRRILLVTAHRRENLGEPMRSMFRAIRRIAEQNKDICVIYPAHKNPLVRKVASEEFSSCEGVLVTQPLDLIDFHNLIARSYLILTDSGGIQEEAAALDKPVLVMRDTTERPEGVAAGTLELVGTREESIVEATTRLLNDTEAYSRMSRAANPFGDGHASERILAALLQRLPLSNTCAKLS